MDAALKQVINLHRAQLQGVIELRGIKRLHKLYAEVNNEMHQKLAGLVRAHKGETFTAHHMRKVLMQVGDGIRILDTKLGAHLEQTGRLAGTLGQRHLVASVKSLEKRYTGVTPILRVEQAGVAMKLYDRVHPSLLDRYKRSVAFYKAPVVAKVRKALAHSILSNETVGEAVDRVAGADGVFEGERWRAERIVRTELTYTYGVVKQRSMEGMRGELPDLQKRLVATFDDRTGDDSKQLNGQTVDVDKPFKWRKPNGEVVEYMQPPNRPNDREVVIPWRRAWGAGAIGEPGDVDPSLPASA